MPAVEILTGVGRIVNGHPRKPRDLLEDDGKTKKLKDGQPIPQYYFGFAIPKAEWAPIAAAMSQAATGIQEASRPDFAWKFKDGDTGVDGDGKPLNLKPGMAGHMILSVSTTIGDFIKCYQRVDASTWREMTPDQINTGDFVRVRLVIEGHGKKPGVANSKAGLYINPQGVEFVGYGEKIFSGVDAKGMFGDAPAAALPPGASATPLASTSSVAMPSAAPSPAAPAPAPIPATYPQPVAPAPAPLAPAPIAPVAAPAPVPLAAPAPAPAMAPAPIASPSSAPAPAHDFVAAAAGRQPVAFDPTNGKPIYGYTRDASNKDWPIYGYDPAGNPVYQ